MNSGRLTGSANNSDKSGNVDNDDNMGNLGNVGNAGNLGNVGNAGNLGNADNVGNIDYANGLPKEFIIKTRYRGSKTRVLPLIFNAQINLKYNSVLDLFGGTGSVSYLFKRLNKKVIYNDHLKFNHIVGRALIENSDEKLTVKDVSEILKPRPYNEYPHLIENYFKDIYYTDEENRWLDRIIYNINQMESLQGNNKYKKDMALWCLFQSCIIKRPFSLFHRKNLNLRLNDVKRSFGNKKTWDTPFEIHYRNFVSEINSYIYKSPFECRAFSEDVLKLDLSNYLEPPNHKIDLVYIDPPYIPDKGENINYRDIYHFLEGITDYNNWESKIDLKSKHRRLIPVYNPWNDANKVEILFKKLIEKYRDSMIMISHRSNGIPTIDFLINILREFGKKISVVDSIDHKYALSLRKSKEVLILGV